MGKRLGTPLAAAPGGGVGGMGLESIREKKAWETGCRSMGRLPRPVGALVRATAPRSRGDDFGKGVTPSLYGSHSRRGTPRWSRNLSTNPGEPEAWRAGSVAYAHEREAVRCVGWRRRRAEAWDGLGEA